MKEKQKEDACFEGIFFSFCEKINKILIFDFSFLVDRTAFQWYNEK